MVGSLDRLSYNWANRLLDNDPNACVIEISMGGLVLQSAIDTQIAITGGDAELTINAKAVSSWQTHSVKSGDKIAFGFAKTAARHYLAIKGGFQIEPMFDSCATVTREKFGSLNGEALKENDTLPCLSIPQETQTQRAVRHSDQPEYSTTNEEALCLRVVLGYQHHSFNHIEKTRFFNNTFTVNDKCDRMGFRLTGAEIKSTISDMLSEGICYGAIQIPADGQPIILLNDRNDWRLSKNWFGVFFRYPKTDTKSSRVYNLL